MPTYIEEKRIQIMKFVQDRQASIASGLAALLIIVVGFLIFNFFLNVNKDNSPQTNIANESTESAQITIITESPTPTSTPTATKTPTPTPTKAVAQSNNNDQVNNNGQVSNNGGASVTLPQTYVIAHGDTLGSIAQKFYNDSSKWNEISRANNITNPNLIHAGNKITLPKVESSNAVASNAPSTTIKPAGNVEYVVSRGETLWSIATRFYGSGFEWYRIKNANPSVSLDSNSHPVIFSGQHLTIP